MAPFIKHDNIKESSMIYEHYRNECEYDIEKQI